MKKGTDCMAEEEKQKGKQEQESKGAAGKKEAVGGKSPWIVWTIIGAVIVAASTGGFALSQLLGGTDAVCPASETDPMNTSEKNFDEYLSRNGKDQASWSYDQFEPVVANLDEPGVTRYVRVCITLEMSPEMDPGKGQSYIGEQKLILRDWLTTYFAGLSLEDVRGTRNLEKIKRQIQDEFNEILFPNGKPYIKRILFKEFAVQ